MKLIRKATPEFSAQRDTSNFTTLATLQPLISIAIVRTDAGRLEARWSQIPWKNLTFLGNELIQVCASISGRDESHFEVKEFLFFDENLGWAELAVRYIGVQPMEPGQANKISFAITSFFNQVMRKKDTQTTDCFDESLTDEAALSEALKKSIHAFREAHGGKRLSTPILATSGKIKSELSGGFAPKPPTSLIPHSDRRLVAKIDKICFSGRWFSVHPEQGSFETVFFSVEEFIDVLHAAQKFQHFFELWVIDQTDARGKPISTLKSISPHEKISR